MSRTDSIFTMPTTELQKRADKAEQLLAQLAELFPGLVTMTETDRRYSDGRMRDGEPEALTAVIEVAENHEQYFTPLADKDGGVDPETFETDLLRDHLERREILGRVLAAAVAVSSPLGDTVLTLGEQVRPVLLAAYKIAKPIADSDTKVRTRLAPALDFYGKIGRRGAETRAAKKSAATDQ